MASPPTRHAVQARIAQRSLADFARDAWPIIEPGTHLQWNWHLDVICEHLQAVTDGRVRRLIVNVPPRTMKSRLISVLWPAWVWMHDPASRWMFASYSGDLATDHSVDTRTILTAAGGRENGGTIIEQLGYQGVLDLVGQTWRLAGDMNLKTRVQNTERGSRLATSVTAKATGFGGDYIVADDPHNALEIQSDQMRERVLKWWSGTMSSRGNNPMTVRRVIVMQRLHERDLTGDLIDRDAGYVHLCLPMEYEPEHPHVTPPVIDLPDGTTLPGDQRTTPGELLWPDRYGPDQIRELQRDLGSYGYSGQYQQRPTPAEGGILKRPWWRYYPPDTDLTTQQWDAVYTTWDTALKAKTTSDYTVGIAWGVRGPDRYVLRVVRGQWPIGEAITQMIAMHAWIRENVQAEATPQHYVEAAAMGPDLIAATRAKVPGVTPLTADTDKVARANSVAPVLEAGNVYVPGFPNADLSGYDPARTPAATQDVIEECAAFPNGANDDQVDAVVYGLNPRRWVQASTAGMRRGGTTRTRHRQT